MASPTMEPTNPAALIAACMQLTDEQLASSEREMADVRCILEDAIARLIRDRSSVTALQFQDISDQLLAHASGRLRSVRQELGRARETLAAEREPSLRVARALHEQLLALAGRERPVHSADLEPGAIEIF